MSSAVSRPARVVVGATECRPEVSYVPITDIPPGEIALAWNATQHSPLVADLARAAIDHLADA